MPLPGTTLLRMLASPEPMYTMFGSDAAMAMEPAVDVGSLSVTHFHESPPSSDRQTPPEAVAAK